MDAIPALTTNEIDFIAALDPIARPYLVQHRAEMLRLGIPYQLNSGRRSRTEQELLRERNPSLAAPAGRSKHELGLAWDAVGYRNDAERLVWGQTAEALGLRWGGRWRTAEPWHMEIPGSRDELAQFQRITVIGGLIGVAAISIASLKGKA